MYGSAGIYRDRERDYKVMREGEWDERSKVRL